jgi:methionine synthase I (cobalamin-dependent)/5,10-methylenetetrahydrofolate reductase
MPYAIQPIPNLRIRESAKGLGSERRAGPATIGRVDASSFRSLLVAGPLLTDGGMGTSLIDRGAPVDACFEALNVSEPALVESVHRAFVEAGARLVIANTFGGNRFRLDRHGSADRVASYDHAAVVLARRAGAEHVAGSMGPLGVRLAPYGRVSPSDAFDAYREHATALVDAGVDLIMIETQTDLREMEQALAAARDAAPGLTVVVSATYTKDDRTLLGSTPEQVAARLVDLGADAIGVNCGEGPAQVLRVVRATRPHAGGLPIIARPNAGGPAEVGGRFVYPATPDYVGELAHALLDEGVDVIGGCCGTGPPHTAAIAAALTERGSRPGVRSEAHPGGAPIGVSDVEAAATAGQPAALDATSPPAASSTGLQRKLATGAFVVAVEMEPPRSFNAATLVAAAGTLHDAGADVIDVADSPMAKMRMSAWAACRLVQEHAGVETVLHFPTRGRNLLRLQGDLLGAHALGIRNVFVCVGDPVTIGDYPQGSNNVDVTATGLLALINDDFNEGRDRAGSSIGEPTAFFVGAAVSPNAGDPLHEIRLLKRKVEAGASFLLTQPVYEAEAIARMRADYERVHGEPLRAPFLVGVLPLVTSRHAEFLHNEVPGIHIPDAARERMRKAGDDAWREGLAMAAELVDGLRAVGAAGIYVMPQFGRYDLAAEVVEAARDHVA